MWNTMEKNLLGGTSVLATFIIIGFKKSNQIRLLFLKNQFFFRKT